jgi:hypothetical protein
MRGHGHDRQATRGRKARPYDATEHREAGHAHATGDDAVQGGPIDERPCDAVRRLDRSRLLQGGRSTGPNFDLYPPSRKTQGRIAARRLFSTRAGRGSGASSSKRRCRRLAGPVKSTRRSIPGRCMGFGLRIARDSPEAQGRRGGTAYAEDLKSSGGEPPCGFKSHRRQSISGTDRRRHRGSSPDEEEVTRPDRQTWRLMAQDGFSTPSIRLSLNFFRWIPAGTVRSGV